MGEACDKVMTLGGEDALDKSMGKVGKIGDSISMGEDEGTNSRVGAVFVSWADKTREDVVMGSCVDNGNATSNTAGI